MVAGKESKPVFRDIRRYYCNYCGICRSKKSLITAHVLALHKDKIQDEKEDRRNMIDGPKQYPCTKCHVVFKKPAHLKQHMQGHSFEYQDGRPPEKILQASLIHAVFITLERPFACPVDDCHSAYRRKDHLSRHLLTHQGKLFTCPIESCRRQFTIQANMKRHLKELHDEDERPCDKPKEKLYACSEIGCGKAFKYPSKLRKHEESHIKLESVEVICCEPGCMKSFSNSDCLKVHVLSCHRYVKCPDCGTRQLKKNLKRHRRTHEQSSTTELIGCYFDGCLHKFSKKSNLNKHIKASHLQERPFTCRISGCGKKFPFKHVRDNHEKSGMHVYVHGDFLEADEYFRSRPSGGRKRKYPDIESLFRKRVAAPVDGFILDSGSDYLRWLLEENSQ